MTLGVFVCLRVRVRVRERGEWHSAVREARKAKSCAEPRSQRQSAQG